VTAHEHAGVGTSLLVPFVVLAVSVAAAGYLVGVRRSRRRSAWPTHRTVLWLLGLACVALALVGPLAAAAHGSFSAHAATHVLLGMLAPLLLVLAAPGTLALRALPARHARALSRALRSRLVGWLTHPVVAGLLDVGGLWLLYGTSLFSLVHSSATVHALVHLHVLLAGALLTFSLVGIDPQPHRASLTTRAVVLVAFMAAHSILAKRLYAFPPAGVGAEDGRVGAQIMYYAGDAVHLALVVLLLSGWYIRAGRRMPGAISVGTHPHPRR
jgi:putative membrane protein